MANDYKIAIKEVQTEIVNITKVVTDLDKATLHLSESIRKAANEAKTPSDVSSQLKKQEELIGSLNAKIDKQAEAIKKLNGERKKQKTLLTEQEKLEKSLNTTIEKNKIATDGTNKALIKQKGILNRTNAELRKNDKIANSIDKTYQKLNKRYKVLNDEAKEAGALFGVQSIQFKKASKAALEYRKRIDKIDYALKNHQRNVGNYGSSLSKLTSLSAGLFGALGFSAAISSIGSLVKELVVLATQMEGDSRRASIVFGENLSTVTEEAKKSAIALGLTKKEYVAAAAATQDLLIPLGFQREKASELSIELTNLSGVLSNWVGGQKTASEVSEILTKTILGETEQIKTLGIKIDQSSKSFNLRVKQLQEEKDLTMEQAKALEILMQITSKSADAQTEFLNTTKSLSLQNATANALYREQQEILANSLVPSYLTWLEIKTDIAVKTSDLITILNEEKNVFKKIAVIFSTLNPVYQYNLTLQANSIRYIKDNNDKKQIALNLMEKEYKSKGRIFLREAALQQLNGKTTKELNEIIKLQQKKQNISNNNTKNEVRNLQLINDKLTSLKNDQLKSTSGEEYNEYQKKIDLLQEEKNKIIDLKKIKKGSIAYIQEIIKKNEELITLSTDQTQRNQLRDVNEELKEQIKLLRSGKKERAKSVVRSDSGDLIENLEKQISLNKKLIRLTKDQSEINRLTEIGEQLKENLRIIKAGGKEYVDTQDAILKSMGEYLKNLKIQEIREKDIQDARIKNQEELIDKLQLAAEFVSIGSDISAGLTDRRIQAIEKEQDALDEKYDRQKELVELEVGDEASKQERLRQMALQKEREDEKIQKRIDKEKNRQAKIDKVAAIFQIGVNTSIGMMKAFSTAVTVYDGAVMAALVLAMGLAQTAAVAAQAPPAYKYGGKHDGGLAIIGDGGRHEAAVLPSGEVWKTPKTDTLANLPKGTTIYPDYDKFQSDNEKMRDMAWAYSIDYNFTRQAKKQDNFSKDLRRDVMKSLSNLTINNHSHEVAQAVKDALRESNYTNNFL